MGGCLRKLKQKRPKSWNDLNRDMQEQNEVNEQLAELEPHDDNPIIRDIQGFPKDPDEEGMPMSQVERNNYSRFLQGLNGTGRYISKCILEHFISDMDIVEALFSYSLFSHFNEDEIKKIKSRDFDKLDISLIYKILQNLSAKVKFAANLLPTKGWGNEPSENDFTFGDELERIRLMDEYVKRHADETSLPKKEYKEKYGQYKDLARRVKNDCGLIDGKDVYQSLCSLETVNIPLERFENWQKWAKAPNRGNRLIEFKTKDLIKEGSAGTRVYRGKFNEMDVAVKRIQRDEKGSEISLEAEKEVLLKTHTHDNIVKYHFQEKDEHFVYLALELCAGTIEDFINGNESFPGVNRRDMCRDMMKGIEYLHKKKIVHRDIKPNNILLRDLGKGKYVAVLADFGLSRVLLDAKMSITNTTCAVGTLGWMAPEVFKDQSRKCGYPSDIFSAGLVMCYILSNGKHPYGGLDSGSSFFTKEGPHQLMTIMADDESIERDMINDMLWETPEKRPTADVVLMHPFFWEISDKISYIQGTSDIISDKKKGSTLDETGHQIFPDQGWKSKLSPHLISKLQSCRKYRYESVDDLLRAFRNTLNHIHQMPPEVHRDTGGKTKEDVFNYFHRQFPLLFIFIFNKIPLPKNEYKMQRSDIMGTLNK